MLRLRRVLSALVLAGLFSHCATSSGAAGPAAPGEGVGLRFAWPEGFTAQVVSTSTEAQGEQAPEHKVRHLRLRLEGVGEERKLITEQTAAAEPSATPAPGQPLLTPTLVVGPKGELKRIEGIEQALAEMFKEAERQGIPAEQQKELMRLVGGALEQASRDRWEELVGKWNGLTLKPGVPIERKGRVTVPFFGNSVSTQEQVALKERVPCTEGQEQKRCVRLVLEASMDPADTERAGAELVQRMRAFMKANAALPDAALPEFTVERMQLDSTLELVAEPETLVPHRLLHAGKSLFVLKSTDGEMQTFRLQSERTERFTPRAD